MVKRRSTILGLGALAMGSGAAFSSAALQNAMAADADFRVVVDDDLVVEPGTAFRSGSNSSNDFDPGSGEGWAYDVDELSGDSAFTDNSEFNPEGLSDPGAAAMTDAQNSDLDIQLVTELAENGGKETRFEDFLQVRNEGTTQRDVGFGFSQVGEDVHDGEISSGELVEIYEFIESGGAKVSSTNIESWDEGDVDASANEFDEWLSLEPGETKQVDLEVDTTDVWEEILDMAGGTDPWGGDHTYIDLVDEIYVGTQEDDPPAGD